MMMPLRKVSLINFVIFLYTYLFQYYGSPKIYKRFYYIQLKSFKLFLRVILLRDPNNC